MKARCAVCKKDLSEEIDKKFERFEVGRVTCLKCGSLQKRYVSEADLLLYLSCEEILYTIITMFTAYVYDHMNEKWWLTIFAILGFALAYIAQKYTSRYIYNNAPFKKENANIVLDEDQQKVKKNINTQFVIFFLFAIGGIMIKDYRIELFGALILEIIVTILRFILTVRNEYK